MKELDQAFHSIRSKIFDTIARKNIDINALIFDLDIDRQTFINNFTHRIDDYSFYLQTLTLVENWEE